MAQSLQAELAKIKQSLAASGIALEEYLPPEQLKLFRGSPSSVIQEEYTKLTQEVEENFPDPTVLYCMELLIQKFTNKADSEGDILKLPDEASPFKEYALAISEVGEEEAFRLLKTMFRNPCFIQRRKSRKGEPDSSEQCPI